MTANRKFLEREVARLLTQVVFGTLAESWRRCGNRSCRCHTHDEKHGPFLALTWRGAGKTQGQHVPKAVWEEMRQGVEAWHQVQAHLKVLAAMNKAELLKEAREHKEK